MWLFEVLEVKGHNINLALIKRDTATSTRATPADGFISYALGEDYAFEKHLGIWSYRKSRKRYLLRLSEEGKRFIPPGTCILCQKSKMRKLLICQNTTDVLYESEAKLKNPATAKRGAAYVLET